LVVNQVESKAEALDSILRSPNDAVAFSLAVVQTLVYRSPNFSLAVVQSLAKVFPQRKNWSKDFSLAGLQSTQKFMLQKNFCVDGQF